MRIGAFAVALLNLLLLMYFVCQSLQLPFCTPNFFRLAALPEVSSSQEAPPPPQVLGRPAEAQFVTGTLEDKSFFLPWIQQDFRLWERGGISQVCLELWQLYAPLDPKISDSVWCNSGKPQPVQVVLPVHREQIKLFSCTEVP